MTEVAKKRRYVPESVQGIRVIDVDTHLTEPPDLWTSRAPAKYKERVPKVVRTPQGATSSVAGFTAGDFQWVVDGKVLGEAGGAGVINKDNVKVKGRSFIHWPLTEASPAGSYLEPRLDLMDEVGIWGQIVYPNVVGFGGQAFMKIEDPELRLLCCTIWNDAMAEMYEESGGRINGMAMVPWWETPDRMVAEIERIHSMGLKGVNISSDPHEDPRLKDLSDLSWEPLWDACESLDLPVNFHIGSSQTQTSWFGGSAAWPSFNDNTKLALGSTFLYLGNARVFGNIIFSGLCERHPRLKFVSAESGVGWIPFMLEALDYQADENNVDHLSMKPSDYFRRQMYACFWFESADLIQNIERIGIDRCMFETDFPHPTCLYPDPLMQVAEPLATLEFEDRKKLLGGTAASVYNIDVPD